MALSGDQVVLTEDDIPGTKLKEPLEFHTVSKLHLWLLCRGIVPTTSMKKDQLICKVFVVLNNVYV